MQFPRPFPIISHATQEQQPVQILSAAIPSFARPAVASSRIDSYDGENVTFHYSKKERKNGMLIFALFTKLYSFFYFQLSNELYKKASYFPTLPKHF